MLGVFVFVLQVAEQLFVKGGQIKDAIDMYTAAGHWEEAHKVSVDTNKQCEKFKKQNGNKTDVFCVQLAVECMTEEEVMDLYVSKAQELEADGKFKEAER